MSLTEEQIRHVARLASIDLTPQELEKMKKELSDILDYINQLSDVITAGVLPTSHVHGVVNVFRDDVVEEHLNVDTLKRMAPKFQNGYFVVPKII